MRNRCTSLLTLCITLIAISFLSGEIARLGLLQATASETTTSEETSAEKPTKSGNKATDAAKDATEANANAEAPLKDAAEEKPAAKFETLTLRGQVRYLGKALQDRYDIETVSESTERQLVLDIPGGELVPLVEDIRGRAFRADDRLRGIDVELLVRRYKNSPFVQVIRLSAVKKEGLFVLDYWCDVCAIAMYELKPCDCCQAPNRLRERKVTPQGIADEVK